MGVEVGVAVAQITPHPFRQVPEGHTILLGELQVGGVQISGGVVKVAVGAVVGVKVEVGTSVYVEVAVKLGVGEKVEVGESVEV